MNINIIAVGKLKEIYFKEAQAEYTKRLGGFGKISVIEIPEARLPDSPSENEIKAALEKEAAAISEKLSRGASIVMCIEGKKYSSERFASLISELSVSGTGTLNFIIGSSFGLSDSIKRTADYTLSMSDMTFPHMFARIMILEQIYRAFTIISGKKYHK